MGRAFPEKEGCSVPSTPSISPDDYVFDSCGVPTPPSAAFSLGATPGTVPQPAKTAETGCIVGFLVAGRITESQASAGPPDWHTYKATDYHGCLSISALTQPINHYARPNDKHVSVASVGDGCLLGYWGSNPGLVVYEKPHDDDGEEKFWVRIGGNSSAGDHKWNYAWAEVYKASAGYGGWSTLAGGRSGTTGSNPGRNTLEDMNSSSGVQGNGVDVANLDPAETGSDTFEIMPCTSNNIIEMTKVPYSGSFEYWFKYENGVNGNCSSSSP